MATAIKKSGKMKFLDAHSTSGAVVSCIDFRFRPYMNVLLKKSFGLTDFDLISLAGGAACFALPDCSPRCATVSDDVALAVRAHHVEIIALLSHQNCGKVASCGITFKNSRDEKKFHSDSLRRAAAAIKAALPSGSKIKLMLGFVSVDPKTDRPRIERVK